MKQTSNRTTHGVVLAILLLIVLALWLAGQRSRRLQSSIESGRFETSYTSAIDTLQTRIRALRDKLNAGMPGDLEFLSEKLLRTIKQDDEDAKTPGKPSLDRITLRGIYWSEALPLAEINNRLFKIGDEVEGFTLEEIQPYQIILSDPEGNSNTVSIIKDFHTEETK